MLCARLHHTPARGPCTPARPPPPARARPCLPPARAGTRRRARTPHGADAGGGAEGGADVPWRLMGRSVHEKHVRLSEEQERELAVAGVARECGKSEEEVRRSLEALVLIVPDLEPRVRRNELRPATLARIAVAGRRALAERMLVLRDIFPRGDVGKMVSKRITLLVAREREGEGEGGSGVGATRAVRWNNFDSVVREGDDLELIARKAEAWRAAMPADCRTDMLLSDFPDLLDWDPTDLLEEISERFANQNPTDVLRRNPHVAMMLERNKRDWDPLGPGANTMQALEPHFGLDPRRERPA